MAHLECNFSDPINCTSSSSRSLFSSSKGFSSKLKLWFRVSCLFDLFIRIRPKNSGSLNDNFFRGRVEVPSTASALLDGLATSSEVVLPCFVRLRSISPKLFFCPTRVIYNWICMGFSLNLSRKLMNDRLTNFV